jgi:hypothetical protein
MQFQIKNFRNRINENLVLLFVMYRQWYLVLLVLGDEVVHVALRLGELHLVHALAYTQHNTMKHMLDPVLRIREV